MALKVLDIECDSLSPTVIWVVVVYDIHTKQWQSALTPQELKAILNPDDILIGHNLISFDIPVLNRLWGMNLNLMNCIDTLILSRTVKQDLEGGHSLENWGKILKSPKIEFDKFHEYSEEMLEYCVQDCILCGKVFQHLSREYKAITNTEYWTFPNLDITDPYWIEHEVRLILNRQEENGFQLDIAYTLDLIEKLEKESEQLKNDLTTEIEPTVVQLKTKIKIIPFNPGSRQQVIDRLIRRGWEPTEFTEKGNVKLNDDILETIQVPAASKILRYLLVNKRLSQINSWVKSADENGIVRGKVMSQGAITHRMTHSDPNMAQIPRYEPKRPELLGKECRTCWIPKAGKILVGIDAEGLELRMLAHYMKDPDYIETVVSGKKELGTDVHTVNMKAAGLDNRDVAKTFIYAFLYGAGAKKIALITKKTVSEAYELIERFLLATPGLRKLKEKVEKMAKKGWLPAIDGRHLQIRSLHAALNTLLQGSGAIVMKLALILLDRELKTCYSGRYEFVANVHDEWQIECDSDIAEAVGTLGCEAIKWAGEALGIRCPLSGSFSIGTNWAETH